MRHDCRHCGIIYFVGLKLFAGIGVMAIVLTAICTVKCSERNQKRLEATDSRMSTMKEVIDGIQQVKLGGGGKLFIITFG